MPRSITILRSKRAASSSASRNPAASFTLVMPTEEPRFAGFTKTGKAKGGGGVGRGAGFPGVAPDDDVLHHGQSAGRAETLHHGLIHGESRAQNACAHV